MKKVSVWSTSKKSLRRVICSPVEPVWHSPCTSTASMLLSFISRQFGASLIVAKEGDTIEQGDGSDVSTKNKALQVTSITIFGHRRQGWDENAQCFKVLNQSDARPSHFQGLLKSNGRWRVVIFVGDITQPQQLEKIVKLGQSLLWPISSPSFDVSRPVGQDMTQSSSYSQCTPRHARRSRFSISPRSSAHMISVMVGITGRFSWMTSHTMRDMGKSTKTRALIVSTDVPSFFAQTNTYLTLALSMIMEPWISSFPPS
jgi:hypothetical protein